MSVCGHEDCSCSTGVHEGLTFGNGDLDEHGYWEKPCRICAAAHDAKMGAGRRDELILEYMGHYMQDGLSIGEARRRVERDHQWVFEPAWPFTDSNE